MRIKPQLHLPSLLVCGTITPVKRWILFILCIILGVMIGLLFGWVIAPVEFTNTALADLKQDYKTDYVLMVAEAYQIELKPVLAVKRLADLNDMSPLELIREAILFAEETGYNEHDLTQLRILQKAIEGFSSLPTENSP